MDPRVVGPGCWEALCSIEGMIRKRLCAFRANMFLCECTDESATNCPITREQYHHL